MTTVFGGLKMQMYETGFKVKVYENNTIIIL